MNCKLCGKKNIKKANYCEKCGTLFTNKEKEEAKKQGMDGFLRKIDTYYETLTFHFITEKIWFKIVSSLLILIFGLWLYYGKRDVLKIEDSDIYQYEYNSKEKEYYLYVSQKYYAQHDGKIPLSLYVPKESDTLYIGNYNEKEELLSKDIKSKEEEILLQTNSTENNYYTISTEESMNKKIKVFIYLGSESE